MKGTLYGVGVGPGDPELLTLKAARLIESVPVIAYICNRAGTSRARQTAARHLQPHHSEIAIPMSFERRRTAAKTAYALAARQIGTELDRGRDVAALCEGDPLLYGSFVHLLEAMPRDHSCRVIPGISAVNAAAAAARTPLVSGAEQLAVVPGSAGDDALTAALDRYDSVAILKPARERARIIELLRASGRLSEAVYVSAATRETETVVYDLNELPATPGPYFALFLVNRHCQR